MKKTITLLILTILLLSICACGKYGSKYKAVGFVHSNESTSASMSFYSFEGIMVFKLKSANEGDIKFHAKMESGSATVYYDVYGNKLKLFSINGGEELNSHGGYVDSGISSAISINLLPIPFRRYFTNTPKSTISG